MTDNCLFFYSPFGDFIFPPQNTRFPYICMRFVNYTPHDLCLNDGTVIPASGQVARVAASFTGFDSDGVCKQVFGSVTGLPPQEDGVLVIVSALVMQASDRTDLVAPATGHPDCVRDEAGRIKSVPGFVRKA